jgi:HlyD family secretion protein
MNRLTKRAVMALVLLAIVTFPTLWFLRRSDSESVSFRTAPVKKGDLLATISATGTVEPEEVIDVGAQVAGQILSFGQDVSGKPVDYGSVIEQGTVLAQIDDSLYKADVANATAQLVQARAGLQRAEADLGQMQAKLVQTDRDWKRAQKLGPSDALSQSDFDAALSGYEVAKANVGVGKAAIEQAKGTVAEAEAILQKAQRNLDYCTIRSPVKGVIIDRRVNIGQTVVASLNAPSLFLIAKDLKRMQVWISVNEADIGSIHPGQPVTFTVDAYPGETFKGEVGKVRLNATMTQNVVTYTVEVITDNSSGKLLPYLTANAKFMVADRRNVLIVPNTALRWAPEPAQIVPESRGKEHRKLSGDGRPPAGREAASHGSGGEESGRGTVWIPQGDMVRPVRVSVGMTDGSSTEIQGKNLKEGDSVVVGEVQQEAGKPSPGGSPFTPQLFRRGH